MSDLAAALMVAIRVHAGQVDKQGEPYLLHVLRVVKAVGPDAKIVAVLHDALEDGPEWAAEEVFGSGCLDDDEAQAVGLLTRGSREVGETYAAYIAGIREGEDRAHRLAREVKLADLRDNLGRIPTYNGGPGGTMIGSSPDWRSLKDRYEEAIERLENVR